MYTIPADSSKIELKNSEDIIKWFEGQISSLTDLIDLFGSYDTRGAVLKLQVFIMKNCIKDINKNDLKTPKEIIDHFQHSVEVLEDGIEFLSGVNMLIAQEVKGKVLVLKSIIEKLTEYMVVE